MKDLTTLLQPAQDPNFVVGALYNRKKDIHGRFKGQERGGISTPKNVPFIFIFMGEAGKAHGYFDSWAEDGTLHYFGEGQKGDMEFSRGNLAIAEHEKNGKRLLIFQALGKGEPYRFLGEFRCTGSYICSGIPGTNGKPRKAIVFQLSPLHDEIGSPVGLHHELLLDDSLLGPTVSEIITEIRTKQALFRRRLSLVEKECRLTGIRDLRFLRASHIKPWASSSDTERVNPSNGLLLAPHADHLFDRGWISFSDSGKLLASVHLPDAVRNRIGLNFTAARSCGSFSDSQQEFLEYHRNCVYNYNLGQDTPG